MSRLEHKYGPSGFYSIVGLSTSVTISVTNHNLLQIKDDKRFRNAYSQIKEVNNMVVHPDNLQREYCDPELADNSHISLPSDEWEDFQNALESPEMERPALEKFLSKSKYKVCS